MIDGNTTALVAHEREEASAEEHYRLYVRPLLPRARREITEELLLGFRIGHHDLETVLDELCNDENYHDFLAKVAQAVSTRDIYWLRRYVESAVDKYLDTWTDLVEDRARRLSER